MEVTWDGQPVAREPPYVAVTVTTRVREGKREFLLLHRRNAETADGDWAWTPPAGARRPGEEIAAAARRELREETGLEYDPQPSTLPFGDAALFVVEVPADVEVRLDDEHDVYEWVTLDVAAERCLPAIVAQQIRAVAATL